jgi:mannose-1-phosphate guanylyltransferase
MILCAGHGTRLAPLTNDCPKPLLPMGDRPQLAHLFEGLAAQGVASVVINTHHLPDAFAGLDSPGLRVHVSHEPELLGTAGALRFARVHLAAPVVVWNGDILAEPELAPLWSAVEGGGIVLLASPPTVDSGTLGLDAEGHVVRLRKERFGSEVRAADYVGVMALGDDALATIPQRGCLIGDVCLPWLRAGKAVRTLTYTGAWADIGSISAYHRANLKWLERQEVPFHVGPGAGVVSGVTLLHSVVGAGARVEGEGVFERCVVLPGARAKAPLADAVVTVSGEILGV